jgi:hypothetical protein
MPNGPKGEKRPTNPIGAGIMAARVAVGDIDEEYVEKPQSTPNRSKGGHNGGKALAKALTPEQTRDRQVRCCR